MMGPHVGVLDWGIGGLDALARLRRRFPGLVLTYLSDSGAVPYGKLGADELDARVTAVVAALGVTHCVIACNAASSVLPLREPPCPMVGVIAPGVAAALRTPYRRIGVVGGARTVASGAWSRPLEAAGREVVQSVAQPLSAHVEAGRLGGPELEGDLARVLAPIREAGVEALVLACTHYPAIAGAFARQLPGVALLDPVDALIDAAAAAFPLGDAGPGAPGPLRVLTTGDPAATRASARLAWGLDLEVTNVSRRHICCGTTLPESAPARLV